jgi:AcrR family transcriptional regulator
LCILVYVPSSFLTAQKIEERVDKVPYTIYNDFKVSDLGVVQMETRSIQKQKTKQRILDAAYGQFGQKGILAARMQDVAEAAGVSHGTVFMHFKTQEELVTAVIEDFGSKACMRTHELAAGQSGVRGVLNAHLQAVGEFEDFYYRLVAELPRFPAASRATFISLQSAISLHISEAAEREMQKGSIRRMPMHLLFNTWMGLVQYYLLNRELFAPGESVMKRYGQELTGHFMELIGRHV